MSATIHRLFDAKVIEQTADPLIIPLPPLGTSFRVTVSKTDVARVSAVFRLREIISTFGRSAFNG